MKAKRAFDLAISTAWHTEAFARTKQLPKLATLLSEGGKKSSATEALAFFHGLRAKGVPVKIWKTPRA